MGPRALERDGDGGGGLVHRTQGGRKTVGGGERPAFETHMLGVSVSTECEEAEEQRCLGMKKIKKG